MTRSSDRPRSGDGRVGRFRVVFPYLPGRVIECVYAEERKIIHEVFEAELRRILADD